MVPRVKGVRSCERPAMPRGCHGVSFETRGEQHSLELRLRHQKGCVPITWPLSAFFCVMRCSVELSRKAREIGDAYHCHQEEEDVVITSSLDSLPLHTSNPHLTSNLHIPANMSNTHNIASFETIIRRASLLPLSR